MGTAVSSSDDSNPVRRLELANNLWESSVALFPLANDVDPAKLKCPKTR
jgi:hypothetical protein